MIQGMNAMRDFFIRGMEMIINVAVVLGSIGVIAAAISATIRTPNGGLLQGIVVLVAGALWLILAAGMIYLALGIYANTRRTAEAVEELLSR